MSVYVDSSFLLSLYITDVHSQEARRRVQDAPSLVLTSLHRAEWEHALGQQQFRRNLTTEAAMEASSQFISDEVSGLWRDTAFPERALEVCADLARRHGAKIGMRILDTLHVACALELKAERFWTFDERQAKLAEEQGLKIR